jgi:hypothetical protein
MKRLSLVLGALALALVCSQQSKADTFNFSFTGSQFDGSGSFVATSLGSNQYKITSATGTIDGSSISLLGVNAFQSNDNLLFDPGFTQLGQGPFNFDNQGASFRLTDTHGNTVGNVNLSQANFLFFLYDSAYLDPSGNRLPNVSEGIDLTVTNTTTSASPVPEPNTLALLGTGVLGLAGVVRRKFAA